MTEEEFWALQPGDVVYAFGRIRTVTSEPIRHSNSGAYVHTDCHDFYLTSSVQRGSVVAPRNLSHDDKIAWAKAVGAML